jgi:hypothetical protein
MLEVAVAPWLPFGLSEWVTLSGTPRSFAIVGMKRPGT